MIGRWYFRPAPAARLGATRVLVGAFTLQYLVRRWRLIIRTAAGSRRNFRPIGVARPLPRGIDEHFNALLSEGERSAIACGLQRAVEHHATTR